jgi:hypothetical protein
MMSSTLVETVSINYEDFNDSFLTCGTCLCVYDSTEHSPKLLPCSHTVCRNCLERIVESQIHDTGYFRCPICREHIGIPRAGVTSFPPSFLVNQLLDLMSRQRRDVIPKCSSHNNQELLFCETCDSVFCTQCAGGLMVFNTTFNNISVISLTNFITYCCIEYTSWWTRFELTTLMVIGTDCTESCKSNNHTITTTMAP